MDRIDKVSLKFFFLGNLSQNKTSSTLQVLNVFLILVSWPITLSLSLKIANGINVVFEQYPDLKANQNALQLQEEIVSTENKLSFAKQAFNDSIERYNAYKKSFFQGMVVNMFRAALDKTFTYWQLSKDDAEKKEDYSVKF